MNIRRLGPGLAAALLVLAVLAAYARPLRYELPMDLPPGLALRGVGEGELSERGPFRWLGPESSIGLPPVGAAPRILRMQLFNPVAEDRTLSIAQDGQLLGQYPLRSDLQRVLLLLPPDTAPALQLAVEPPFQSADGRTLGTVAGALTLAQVGPALPPLGVLGQLALIVALGGALGLAVGARALTALWAALGLGLLAALGLLLWRMPVLLALGPLILALLAALPLALLLWVISRRWGAPAERRWVVAVRATGVALFVLRVVGMWHPQFIGIDHGLRTHQVIHIAQGRGDVVADELSRQYEWGDAVRVPYSLAAYYPFVPLADLVEARTLRRIIEGGTAAAEALVVLALLRLLLAAGWPARAGWWAAALYVALPGGLLYYHDGSFPTIMGLAVTALLLPALLALLQRPGWRPALLTAGLLALSMLLYVTHLLFVPLLAGLAMASAWLSRSDRAGAKWLALTLVGGVLLALVSFYGRTLPTLFTVTIPAVLSGIEAEGAVGREGSPLPPQLVGPFWLQAWGHFRVLGLLLALAGLPLLWRRGGQLRHLGLAYVLFVALTALVDLRFGLWNKHLYFALPGVALLGGVALHRLADAERRWRPAAWGLLGLLALASIHAWAVRVVLYEWSLRTM